MGNPPFDEDYEILGYKIPPSEIDSIRRIYNGLYICIVMIATGLFLYEAILVLGVN